MFWTPSFGLLTIHLYWTSGHLLHHICIPLPLFDRCYCGYEYVLWTLWCPGNTLKQTGHLSSPTFMLHPTFRALFLLCEAVDVPGLCLWCSYLSRTCDLDSIPWSHQPLCHISWCPVYWMPPAMPLDALDAAVPAPDALDAACLPLMPWMPPACPWPFKVVVIRTGARFIVPVCVIDVVIRSSPWSSSLTDVSPTDAR